jgi:diketogulonate reductase-like aldo/keto reductase
MPMLGLGTWQNDDADQCAESVRTALEAGYRHIDTAQAYENESAVGDGIAAADVDRDDIFLATKVWISNLSYDDVIETTEQSLDKLGVESLDLLYIHWAAGEYDPEETLPAFDELVDRGLIDNVGVSNFEPHHVETAMDVLDAPVFANQVETHPFLQQSELREHAAEQDYELVAYSPLARGEVFGHDVIEAIADNHGVSEAQVSLAWLREKGVTAIPKATSETHITDNLASLDLTLTDAEIDRIDGIETVNRRINPDWSPAAWD